MSLGYGVCVGSWDKFSRFVVPRVRSRPVLAISEQSSIGIAYNKILDAFEHERLEALVLLHDDLEIVDPNAEDKIRAVMQDPNVALVGVAGGRDVWSLAWWDADTVGHQYIDEGRLLKFTSPTGDVQSLEGSFMAFSPWAIQHLRFDTRFTGFHGYDDIGMVAVNAGRRVVVADIDTHHHTQLGFKSKRSGELWREADHLFRSKWNL